MAQVSVLKNNVISAVNEHLRTMG